MARTRSHIWQWPRLLSLKGFTHFPSAESPSGSVDRPRGQNCSPVPLPSLTSFPQSTLLRASVWLGWFPEFTAHLLCCPSFSLNSEVSAPSYCFFLAPLFLSGLSLSTLPAQIGQDLVMKVPLHSGGPLSINGLWKQILSDFRESKVLDLHIITKWPTRQGNVCLYFISVVPAPLPKGKSLARSILLSPLWVFPLGFRPVPSPQPASEVGGWKQMEWVSCLKSRLSCAGGSPSHPHTCSMYLLSLYDEPGAT